MKNLGRVCLLIAICCCLPLVAIADPPEPAEPPAKPAANEQADGNDAPEKTEPETNEPDTSKPDSTEPPKETPPTETDKPEQPNPQPPKQQPPKPELPGEIALNDYLVIPKLGVYGRVPMHRDSLEALVATGEWKFPGEGDTIDSIIASERRWRSGKVDGKGTLESGSIRGGYAVATFDSPDPRVMLLVAKGHANVYVNGRLHAGDAYAKGWLPIPVKIKKGTNELIFQVAQPSLSAKLVAPEQDAALHLDQATLPDVVEGIDQQVWVGLPVTNASEKPIKDAKLVFTAGDAISETPVPFVDRLSAQLLAAAVKVPTEAEVEVPVSVKLVAGNKVLATAKFSLPFISSSNLQRRTFRSAVDGSVQAYQLLPAASSQLGDDGRLTVARDAKPGLCIALHDLGVSASQFISQFPSNNRWHTIAPEGRSAYGFDWEDWSQTDIAEAVEAATAITDVDTSRIVAVGHGMGGHGVLHYAAQRPGKLTAASLVAGWPSLWTYGGGRPGEAGASPVETELLRPATASDTLLLTENLQPTALQLLHAAGDAFVPVDQTRTLAKALAPFHNDYAVRIAPGDDHAFDADTSWQRFFEERLDRSTTTDSDSMTLRTADITLCSDGDWASIEQQAKPFELSTLTLTRKLSPPSISGSTTNATRVKIDVTGLPDDKPFFVQLDKSRPAVFRRPPDNNVVHLAVRADGRWLPSSAVKASEKSARRNGGLKSVFANRPLLVYGTNGTAEQKAWAESKAHYDAETFMYRGNGRLEVIPDTAWPEVDNKDRNVVLYGNADTNRLWPAMFSTSQIQVRKGSVLVDTRPESGDDLAVIMVRPRPDSEVASVAVIGGTGIVGMQLTNRLRYFTAGIDYPDFLVFGPETLTEGTADVRAAGYFDNLWKIDGATIEWRDLTF